MAYEKYYSNFSSKFPDYLWMARLTEALITKASSINIGGNGIAYGGKVMGTDGQTYACIVNHTSSDATKPITGADWQTVWTLAPLAAAGAWVNGNAYVAVDSLPTINNKIRLHGIDKQLAAYILDKTNNSAIENYLAVCKEFEPYIETEAKYQQTGRTMVDSDVNVIVNNQFRNWAQSKYDGSF